MHLEIWSLVGGGGIDNVLGSEFFALSHVIEMLRSFRQFDPLLPFFQILWKGGGFSKGEGTRVSAPPPLGTPLGSLYSRLDVDYMRIIGAYRRWKCQPGGFME